jgi:3-oxoacyl-[acyl-carrier-protein] synthase II
VRHSEVLAKVRGLRTTVAASVPELDATAIDRKKRRYMSAMSICATLAAQEAIHMAALTFEQVQGLRTGVCFGSTTGSSQETEDFFLSMLKTGGVEGLKSTHFFKIMNSSCAVNLAQALGVRGRLLAPSAACATGTIAIGLAAESIAAGKQDVMIAGGADELHPLTVAVFDTVGASSRAYNDRPDLTPRPFDKDRDGVVCGEGAGAVVLEELEHAQARKADILGEVRGFAVTGYPSDMANPDVDSMIQCMTFAIEESGLAKTAVDYVNAHATGTLQGDEAESLAVEALFGREVPVSSLKGHMGHTMAACGALELIATLMMMRQSVLVPTRNLRQPDATCGRLNLLKDIEQRPLNVAMINSFALGGVNSAMVVSGRLDSD